MKTVLRTEGQFELIHLPLTNEYRVVNTFMKKHIKGQGESYPFSEAKKDTLMHMSKHDFISSAKQRSGCLTREEQWFYQAQTLLKENYLTLPEKAVFSMSTFNAKNLVVSDRIYGKGFSFRYRKYNANEEGRYIVEIEAEWSSVYVANH